MFLPERDDANVSQETKKEIIFMQKKVFFLLEECLWYSRYALKALLDRRDQFDEDTICKK